MRADFLVHLALHGARDIHPGGAPATDRLLAALKVDPGARVLEIGCGTGISLTRILQMQGVTVAGLDFTPEMLRLAERRLRWAGLSNRAMLVRGHMQRLPFADQSFERAFAESVIGFQDTAIVRKTMKEIFRVLKPGGLLASNDAVWTQRLDPSVLDEINAGCIADFGLRQASQDPWVVEDWLNEFSDIGFEVDSAESHEAQLGKIPGPASKGAPLRASLAAWPDQLRSRISLRCALERKRYRQLMDKHRSESELTDAVLFVLRKPLDGPSSPITRAPVPGEQIA